MYDDTIVSESKVYYQENLSWHRVVNSQGEISLKPRRGYEVQKALLRKKRIEFDENDIAQSQEIYTKIKN